jgi:predicted nucleic acid-binding protein
MNVLVDTSVWSLALRRAKRLADDAPRELAELIGEGRVVMIGPVRQELLSGIKLKPQYETLREHLRAFPDVALETADYEQAASAFNRCRERGVQGSSTAFLICAVAMLRGFSIYTTDDDFKHYAKVLKLELHRARN